MMHKEVQCVKLFRQKECLNKVVTLSFIIIALIACDQEGKIMVFSVK